MRGERSGSALVMVLVIAIVLDCIVIGTMYLALLEHRLGANHVALLRLRLAAGDAARQAAAGWSIDADTMPIGPTHRIELNVPDDTPRERTHVWLERLGERLFLISTEAVAIAPRYGRARARLLIRPPALPPGTDVAPAPVTVGASVHVRASAEITTAAPADCSGDIAPFTILAGPAASVVIDPSARLDAPAGTVGSQPLHAAFDRMAALARDGPGVLVIHGDRIINASSTGVVIADGNLTIAPPAVLRGLVFASGMVTIAVGAEVIGAVHSVTDVIIDGTVRGNGCAVRDAVDAAGLERPEPAGRRAWIPSF